MRIGILPTVPEYYQEFIDSKVDLIFSPKQCCPFHEEDTPSFSYNKRTGRWSCFGKCHAHGDVYEMHRRHFRLGSYEEAVKDLNARCGLPMPSVQDKLMDAMKPVQVQTKVIEDETLYVKACLLAKTVEHWLMLDRIMDEYPVDNLKLNEFVHMLETGGNV